MSAPGWLTPLLSRLPTVRASDISRLPTPRNGRASAVLVLFGDGVDGPDVLLLQRAATLRNHAGQPAFPGGAADGGDRDADATALREAEEEVGLRPSTVDLLGELPRLWIPVSGFVVTPVLGWWREPHEVRPMDPQEVARVERVPLAELADPAHRLRVRHPSGYMGPAFRARGMLIWGFTAGILSALLDLGGWALPWDSGAPPERLPLPEETPAESHRPAS